MVVVGLPLPGQPSSPWATRFVHVHPDHNYEEDGTVHSILAIADPRTDDPKRYDSTGISRNPFQKGNKEIDRVFWHEETQKQRLFGLETWEAAILNRWLYFGADSGFISAGHRGTDNGDVEKLAFECYARGGLKIDETQWLPFLRKNRWYDWIETLPIGRKDHQGLTWSVDNPNIWDTIKTSLELRQLQTILWGPIEDWNQVAQHYGEPQVPPHDKSRVLVSPHYERIIAAAQAPPNTQANILADFTTRDDWRERLIALMKNTCLCLVDLHTDRAWAFTDTYKVPSPLNIGTKMRGKIIVIATALVEKMADKDLCLGELCSLQIFTAFTMVHEIMHAILMGRYSAGDDNFNGNRWDRTGAHLLDADEPYLDCGGDAEAGACELMTYCVYVDVFEKHN
ncbi:hypothetical protein F5Y18DRAFT_427839 [Xylariaceae sp. FL1019]|nr:hypothetical protein F5Y18DRAFT_427839 [Xylariaceae sp. FL1019]